jgi:hypothetical protein
VTCFVLLAIVVPMAAPASVQRAVVSPAVNHDASPALRRMPVRQPMPVDSPEGVGESDVPSLMPSVALQGVDFVAQLSLQPLKALPIVQNFPGIAVGLHDAVPPDANGAVGLQDYVQVLNNGFAVFTKSGLLLYGPAAPLTLFQGFTGLCGGMDKGDPTVLYDRFANRWILSQMAWASDGSGSRQCIAVSQTDDPMGAWYRYEFVFTGLADYTKLGVWSTGYILTTGTVPPQVCALDRTRMLAGKPAAAQCFQTHLAQPLPADLDGNIPPPLGSPAFLVDQLQATSTLGLYELRVNWDTPADSSLTDRIPIAVAPWENACAAPAIDCIPQPGTSQKLRSVGDQIMNRVTYRNLGDHQVVVVNHTSSVQGITGLRWYELRPDGAGAASVFQQGTFVPDLNHRWMGSSAMDRAGDIAVGYSISSDSVYPSIRYAGRFAGDPPGILTVQEGSIYDGTHSQTTNPRWGDYASLQVDPIDDCTFWFTTEYAGSERPETRVAAFRFPSCARSAFSLAVDPVDVSFEVGKSTAVNVMASTTAGSSQEVALRVDGLPDGVTASFSSATVMTGQSVQLTLSATAPVPVTRFSIMGTSSAFQDGLIATVAAIRPSSAPTPARSRTTGCSSAQSADASLLLLLLGFACHQKSRRCDRRG